MKKISWYDLSNMTTNELKKKYKTTDLGIEQRVRTHLDGANAKDRRDVYKAIWDKEK